MKVFQAISILSFLMLGFNAQSIDKGKLSIRMTVFGSDGKTLENVQVLVEDGTYDVTPLTHTSGPKGREWIKLGYSAIYRIQVWDDKHLPFDLLVNTHLPEELIYRDYSLVLKVHLLEKDMLSISDSTTQVVGTRIFYEQEGDYFRVKPPNPPIGSPPQQMQGYLKSKAHLILTKAFLIDITTNQVLRKVSYRLKSNGEVLIFGNTNNLRKFELSIPLGGIYHLELEKEDYFKTTHIIDTRMPEKYDPNEDFIQKNLNGIPMIHRDTQTIKNRKQLPLELVESTPFITYYYDPEKKYFVEDPASIIQFQKQIGMPSPTPAQTK